ncbi:MAG: hypothetical protein MJK15_22895 [Colwellia sp.]|nr:hypothetical protein [Colwellia sp.]
MNKCSNTSHLTSAEALIPASGENSKQVELSANLVTASLNEQNKTALASDKAVKMAAIDVDNPSFVLGYN